MTTTTTTTTTTATIKPGKCQFNASSAKNFRTVLAKWHNATFEIADELLQKNDRVSALRKLIATNDDLIKKIENGQTVIGGRTAEEVRTESADLQKKIDAENSAMAEYRKAQADRLKSGEDLVSKSLFEAYEKYVDSPYDSTYFDAIAMFLQTNGVEPAHETIKTLAGAVSKKSASARQMCKSGKHNTAFSFVQWRKIFLGELCDMMGDCLPLYKFIYVLKENRKKSDK